MEFISEHHASQVKLLKNLLSTTEAIILQLPYEPSQIEGLPKCLEIVQGHSNPQISQQSKHMFDTYFSETGVATNNFII